MTVKRKVLSLVLALTLITALFVGQTSLIIEGASSTEGLSEKIEGASYSLNDVIGIVGRLDDIANGSVTPVPAGEFINLSAGTTTVVDQRIFEALARVGAAGHDYILQFRDQAVNPTYSWNFTAKSIDTTKINANGVDLKITISTLDTATDALKKLVNTDSKAILVNFADNGVLPGKATVTIGRSATMNAHFNPTLTSDVVNFFYYNLAASKLETSSGKAYSDTYTLDVDHNSTFLITNYASSTTTGTTGTGSGSLGNNVDPFAYMNIGSTAGTNTVATGGSNPSTGIVDVTSVTMLFAAVSTVSAGMFIFRKKK